MSKELSSLNEFHDKIDAEVILEYVLHVHYKWMIYLEQDVFFQFNVLKLLIFDYNVFSDAFHCIYLLVYLILNEIDFSKSAFAYHAHNNKILEACLPEISRRNTELASWTSLCGHFSALPG